ncbi:hypothetical protein KAT51_00565 [bacterium]|nr:hypothetical protein [bacterium]
MLYKKRRFIEFLEVCGELEHQREETKFWMEAFKNTYDLRKDAEQEVRELKAKVDRLEDKLWFISGGY